MKRLRFDYAGTFLVCLHIYASVFNKLEPLCKLHFKELTAHHYRLYINCSTYSIRFRTLVEPQAVHQPQDMRTSGNRIFVGQNIVVRSLGHTPRFPGSFRSRLDASPLSPELFAAFIGWIFLMFPYGNPLELFLAPSHGSTLSLANFTSRQS
jgi:hypothetical protein